MFGRTVRALRRRTTSISLLALLVAGASGCGRRPDDGSPVVARWSKGTVTRAELQREASRMPPALRREFDTPAGERDLANALIDRRLLDAEARRRGLADDPEIRRQVQELEGRLVVRALLEREEKAAGPAGEGEARAYYDAHRADFDLPSRVRVSRVLAAVPTQASEAERAKARARAQRFLARLQAGEPFARVAADGEGAERTRGGDLGLITAREGKDPSLEQAALALPRAGALSEVLACADGFAVLRLDERREGRSRTFEEVRGEVLNRLEPQRKRRIFDALLERLRSEAEVKVESAAAPR